MQYKLENKSCCNSLPMSCAMDKNTAETSTEQFRLLRDLVFDEQGLSDEARRVFPNHLEILCVYERHRQSVLHNNCLTHVGRHLIFTELKDMYDTCKSVLNYIATNSEVLCPTKVIATPLIMCGLPRTGSTLLYNLLACDPHCRAPLATDMFIDCVPPVPRSNSAEHERRAMVIGAFKQRRNELLQRSIDQSASHPVLPIEEDYLIFRHVGLYLLCHMKTFDYRSESETWLYNETNKDFVYQYHKLFLLMLNSVDEPRSHWLLKGILHTLYLDTLLEHYPQASLIMTHRRLDEVLPSFSRFLWVAFNFYFDANDPVSKDLVNTISLELLDAMIQRVVKFRTSSRHSCHESFRNICDIAYDDLIEQPIATVRRIYDHFSLSYSKEFEAAMEVWLRENPQGKQGRNAYNLAHIHLTQEEIETRYKDYINMFLVRKQSTDHS